MRTLITYDTVYGSTAPIAGWITKRDAAKAQATKLESELESTQAEVTPGGETCCGGRGREEATPETCPEHVEGSDNLPQPQNIRVSNWNYLTITETYYAKV